MSHTFKIRYWAVTFVLLLCTLAGTAAAIELPSIAVDRPEDDFGDVYVGKKVQKRFVISNKGTAPLAIEYIRSTCGCTTATAAKRSLAPGETTELVVSYDTAGLGAGKTTQAVKINSNDPKHSVLSIRLYANIVREVVLDPQNLVSKMPGFQNPVIFSVLAKNKSDKPVVLQLTKFEGAIAKAVFQPELPRIEPKSEQRFLVELFLVQEEKSNLYRGSLFLATNHPKEKEIVVKCYVKIARKHGLRQP